jgi:hypothetical protein
LAELSSETHHLVEKVADGVLRLVRLSNPTAELGNRKRKHRHILDILANKPELRSNYLELLTRLAVKRSAPSTDEWNEKWSAIVTAIAEAIDGAEINSENVKAFLDWRLSDDDDQQPNKACQRDNMFRDPPNDPKVEIHVGSIHSVKGQTHTATLVLDTYFHEHQLASLKPWLLGQKTGRGKEGTRNLSRLKQHYVAMTRPTHLLCLAMREDTFTYEETGELKSLSWRVARIGNTAPEWL